MLRQIINKFGTSIYAQIWEDRIKLTDLSTKKVFDEKPLLAIERNKNNKAIVVSIGNAAELASGNNIEIKNPFSHPRVLFADFPAGEKVLQYGVRTLLGNKAFSPAPAIIIHPMEKTEGGLTMIEVRAFRELAFGAGARDAVVYQGRELSVHEINFKSIKESVGEQ